MNMHVLPIYNDLFSDANIFPSSKQWENFKTYPDSKDAIFPSKVDFSINEQKTWRDTLKKTTLILLKIVLFPWILYDGMRYFLQRIAMRFTLLAQFEEVKKLDDLRKEILNECNFGRYIARHVSLEKNGTRYSGLLIAKHSTISNEKWALCAQGNFAPYEDCFKQTNLYLRSGFNVLFINPPNVGRSKGSATPDTLGDAQEIGLSFLESAIKAKKIACIGISLGGAAIGRAIMQHTFNSNINYLVIRLVTFDKLSNMAKRVAGTIGSLVTIWLGYEMDSVPASRKLQELNIHEVVIQGGNDDLIGNASLLNALKRESITENKTFTVIPEADHNDFAYNEIKEAIESWDYKTTPSLWKRFFQFSMFASS